MGELLPIWQINLVADEIEKRARGKNVLSRGTD